MKIPICTQSLSSKGIDANERLSSAWSYLDPRTGYQKRTKATKAIRKAAKHSKYLAAHMDSPLLNHPSSDGYLLHRTEHSAVISTVLGYVPLSQVGIIVPNNSIKFIITSFS